MHGFDYWRYEDNKKDYLIYRTEFKYDNGKLIGELEFDSNDNISREMKYNEDILRTAKYCAWLITVDEVDNG
jgi:hypothetical protein